MSKKKITVLSTFYEPFMSGAEQMVKEVLEQLGPKHEMNLVTARLDKSLPKIEQRDGFTIHRVGIGHKKLDKFLYPILAALKVRQINPEITHAIMESYAGGALVLISKTCPDTKRILTLQSGDMDHPRNQKRLLFKLIWKKIHTSPDIVTAISSFLRQRAINLGVKEENLYITPNGLDFSKVPQNVEKIPNRVVCLARLSWEKGLDYLIKAWPAVIENIPNAKLVFVGEGDKRKDMERMIEKLNIKNSVSLLGLKPHDEALIELSKSEIFVCPSLAEGLGNVFFEAQACGVPPIGTRVGGIGDVIEDGVNGVLIDTKNSQQISDALIRLLSDKEYTHALSKKALESVKKFDWKTIIKNINLIYLDF